MQVGASWPIETVAAQLLKSNKCPLCNHPVDTEDIWHNYWTCPCIINEDSQIIKDSNGLIEELSLEEVTFFNGALVCEHHIKAPNGFTPLDDYVLFSNLVDNSSNALKESPQFPKLVQQKGSVLVP